MKRWMLGCVSLTGVVACNSNAPPLSTAAETCARHHLDEAECAAKVRSFLAPVDPIDGKELEWRFLRGSLRRAGWRPMRVVDWVQSRAHEVTPVEVEALMPGAEVTVGDEVALAVDAPTGLTTTFAVPPEHPDSELLFEVLGGFMARAVPKSGPAAQLKTIRNPDDHTVEVVRVRRIVRWFPGSAQEMALVQARLEDPGVQVGDELLLPLSDPPSDRVASGVKHWLASFSVSKRKRLPASMVDLHRLQDPAAPPGAVLAGTATVAVEGALWGPVETDGGDCLSYRREGRVLLTARHAELRTDLDGRPSWALQLHFMPDNTLDYAYFADHRGHWEKPVATVAHLERTDTTLQALLTLQTEQLGPVTLDVQLDCAPALTPAQAPGSIVELVSSHTDLPVVRHPTARDPTARDPKGIHRAVEVVVLEDEAPELRDRLRTVLPSGWHAYIGPKRLAESGRQVAVVVAPAGKPSDLVRLAEVTPDPTSTPTAQVAHVVDELDARYGLVIDRASLSHLDAHFVRPPVDPDEQAAVMAALQRFCPTVEEPVVRFAGDAFSCRWD